MTRGKDEESMDSDSRRSSVGDDISTGGLGRASGRWTSVDPLDSERSEHLSFECQPPHRRPLVDTLGCHDGANVPL